jgi:DNA-binding CsgD family transcriptional regulator
MKTENEAFNYSIVYHDNYKENSWNSGITYNKNSVSNNQAGSNPLYFFGYCLIDHTGKQFACIHEHCKEYNCCLNNELLKGNPDYHPLHFHPDDRIIWREEALPDIQKFANSIPAEELPYYRFSFNHRYIHKDGNVSQFLHEGTLALSEEACRPVLNLKVFTEIGDIKTDDTMVLTIFRYLPENGYKKVFTKVYGETQNGQLSLREKEIIKLCLDGLSSKMIADKLNLSIHTVKNHKRNSMEKTLTHNIAELISLCIRSRWL